MLDSLLVVLYLFGMFTLLVATHEWGHMRVAKWVGMKVEEFAFGFGPLIRRLWRGRDGTEYTWRAVPLGGFVRIVGMMPNEEHIPDGFQAKSRPARFLTVLAGPLASILLGSLLFMLIGVTVGFRTGRTKPQIRYVEFNTPAAQAGLQIGDVVVGVAAPIQTAEQVERVIRAYPDKELHFQIQREGKLKEITIRTSHVVPNPPPREGAEQAQRGPSPRPSPEQKEGFIGITWAGPKPEIQNFAPTSPAQQAGLQVGDRVKEIRVIVKTAEDAAPLIRANPGKPVRIQIRRKDQILTYMITPRQEQVTEGGQKKTIGRIGVMWNVERKRVGVVVSLGRSVEVTWRTLASVVVGIKQLVVGHAKVEEVGSLITIVGATSATSRLGFAEVVEFAASFSIMLGLINLLPIPVLDGGYLLLITIEAIRRRKLSPKAAMVAQALGFSIVLLLFFTLISLDLYKLASGRLIR